MNEAKIVAMTVEPPRRDPACVERWPECASGEYDPRANVPPTIEHRACLVCGSLEVCGHSDHGSRA